MCWVWRRTRDLLYKIVCLAGDGKRCSVGFLGGGVLVTLLVTYILVFDALLATYKRASPMGCRRGLRGDSIRATTTVFTRTCSRCVSTTGGSGTRSIGVAVSVSVTRSTVTLVRDLMTTLNIRLSLSTLSGVDVSNRVCTRPGGLAATSLSMNLNSARLFNVSTVMGVRAGRFLVNLPNVLAGCVGVSVTTVRDSVTITNMTPTRTISLSGLPSNGAIRTLVGGCTTVVVSNVGAIRHARNGTMTGNIRLSYSVLAIAMARRRMGRVSGALLARTQGSGRLRTIIMTLNRFTSSSALCPSVYARVSRVLARLRDCSARNRDPLIISGCMCGGGVVNETFASSNRRRVTCVCTRGGSNFNFRLHMRNRRLVINGNASGGGFGNSFCVCTSSGIRLEVSIGSLRFDLGGNNAIRNVVRVSLDTLLRATKRDLSFLNGDSILEVRVTRGNECSTDIICNLTSARNACLMGLSTGASGNDNRILRHPTSRGVVIVPITSVSRTNTRTFTVRLINYLSVRSVGKVLSGLPVPARCTSRVSRILVLLRVLTWSVTVWAGQTSARYFAPPVPFSSFSF